MNTETARAIAGRAVRYGLPWGAAIAASEALVLPFGQFTSLAQSWAFAPIALGWALDGIFMALLAFTVEPWLDQRWKVALAMLCLAVAGAGFNSLRWFISDRLGISYQWQETLREHQISWTNYLYVLWMMLFHGGLFVVACTLAMRHERTARMLTEAQISRSRTAALLDAARLDALREQVDPVFLMRAMAVVRDRYGVDPSAADRLLDELVAFLRLAMPGVRSGASRLAVEAGLAARYAQLGAAMSSAGPVWRVVSGPLPDMPFPPLLLLPLMDALLVGNTDGQSGTVRFSLEDAVLEIAFEIPMHSSVRLPADLLYRTRVGLQSVLGPTCRLDAQAAEHAGGQRFVITIPRPAVALRRAAQAEPASGARSFDQATNPGAIP